MSRDEVFTEFGKARQEFERIFGVPTKTAGSAGWQANSYSLEAYDEAKLLYASDSRGIHPFFPRANGSVFKTIQIPTTLPTLDELLGRPEYPEAGLPAHYVSLLKPDTLNVLTIHAEIEGMRHIALFRNLLERIRSGALHMVSLGDYARDLLAIRAAAPVCDIASGTVDGRSGTLAVQKCS
jgi:undecaprenyl phosphate-alpha-L-ara4FN deformylase